MEKRIIKNHPDFLVSIDGEVSRKAVITIRSNGRPLCKKEQVMPQRISPKGYPTVDLARNGKRKTVTVHRLVATTFIDNPKKYPEINHINGIKTDNRAENLEWCTRSMNIKHSFALGLRTHKGEDNVNCKVTEAQVIEIREKARLGISTSQLSKEYGLWNTSIYNIISRRTWKNVG